MENIFSELSLEVLDEFKCIGGECIQSCCSDEWLIMLSEEEYEKIDKAYKSSSCDIHNYFGEIERSGIKKKYIRPNKNKECPFLDESGMCSMQSKFGENILTKTCRIFPRLLNLYGSVFEGSLSTGCEKVVQMLLEKKDGMTFTQKDLNLKELTEYKSKINKVITEKDIEERFLLSYWFDFKVLGLGVLSNRNYTIEERLLLLGVAISRLDSLEKESKFMEIKPYIDSFLNNIDDGQFKDSFDMFKKNEDIKVKSSIQLASIFLYSNNDAKKMVDKMKDKLGFDITLELLVDNEEGIRSNIHVDSDYDKEKYDCLKKSFEKFIDGKEYFFENLIITNYLTVCTPFTDIKRGLIDNYKLLVAFYVIYKFCLISYMDEPRDINDLIKVTVILSRRIMHNLDIVSKLDELLKFFDDNTMAYMALLLL